MNKTLARYSTLTLLTSLWLAGCYEGIDTDEPGFGDGFSTLGGDGDGDGEAGDQGNGDGDAGDGDGDPGDGGPGDGDGDGDAGDGDGDGGPGDGDGDGDPGDGDGDGDPGDGDGDPGDGDPGDGDGDPGDGDGEAEGGDMPNNPYCGPVDNWNADWAAREAEVIELVNQARAQGANCGSQGNFGPAGPVSWEPHLTCAARVHSLDMGTANYFSHTNLQGHGPGWRLNQAGYSGGGWGENIGAGYPSPAAVVQGWLDSDGHCANMLNPGFSRLGVGYASVQGSSYGAYWTQKFGN